MPASAHRPTSRDLRVHRRQPLPLGYCAVSVRRGKTGPTLTGHAYDISMGGVRFELDQPLATGEQIELTVDLPGKHAATIHVRGEIVRLHDDADDPGPVRMGARFRGQMRRPDARSLATYLHEDVRAVA